ncbi:MAG: PepSY domain-containing protein [Pigmentiphaga sp.]|uniref:PepSY domain-containing protein n=1 Tax=Pigmentiphaga sp. TaxID=1977564 RepID=UPI0029BE4874|nr:PepSY domain-containing protein [Pigmentiphaga sp.]MDX3906614.1 PepSY domain-containing protein [Pigmentiphaga sp.]
MRLLPAMIIAVAAAAASSAAQAADKCAYVPPDRWVPIEQVIRKAEELGYQVREVERDDGCWEVEGFDKRGARIKLNLDPSTGEVVRPADRRSSSDRK